MSTGASGPHPAEGLPTGAELRLYRVIRTLVVGFCRLYWRSRVSGGENIPAHGAYIVAPVHRSNIDFALVAGLSRSRLRYMGKDSVWKYPTLGRFFTTLGAFPVHRGAPDREAMRRCSEILSNGEPLVIFPEGTRQSGPLVVELFEGAAYLAAKLGVPVIPVGIGGSEAAMPKGSKFPRPARVQMVVGAPLSFPPSRGNGRVGRASLRAFSDELHAQLQILFDQARIAAGPHS